MVVKLLQLLNAWGEKRIFGIERPSHLGALKNLTFAYYVSMTVDGKNYYASFVIMVNITYLKID